MKVSVTIITLNEEEKIRACLKSVAWADEIIVFDSESSDRTRDIASEFTDNIFVEEEWAGYGRQKNRCVQRAANDWILNIDADETVSDELRDEILGLDPDKTNSAAFSVKRENFIGDRWIRFAGWYPDRIVRLYDRRKAAFTETRVHEGVKTDSRSGGRGRLGGHLIHETYESLEDYFKRQERYAVLSAEDMADSGRSAGFIDLTFRPLLSFLKVFIVKNGFLEGYYGLALAYGQALYTYKKYKRLKEIREMTNDRPGN